MGRRDTRRDWEGVTNFCVSRPQSEYDSGGAYWGLGGLAGPVWAVWERGKGHEGVAYVRARSKSQAIQTVLID